MEGFEINILLSASGEKQHKKGCVGGVALKLSSYSDPTHVAFQNKTGLSSLGLPIHWGCVWLSSLGLPIQLGCLWKGIKSKSSKVSLDQLWPLTLGSDKEEDQITTMRLIFLRIVHEKLFCGVFLLSLPT